MTTTPTYTAISFAPVQGFIEKSRKLRDLFGASLILSYLSQQLAEQASQTSGCRIISPALISVQQGMPNRILIEGEFSRNDTTNTLIGAWRKVLNACQAWLEDNIPAAQTCFWQEEWQRWQQYTWEIFWGQGESPAAAMQDLERRKLKRDWTAINWVGGSSSLTGTDAIAWPRLGEQRNPKTSLSDAEKSELDQFYRQLAWILDDPYQRSGQLLPPGEEPEGKFVAANERLSLPELVKRLVTLPKLAKTIGMTGLEEGFTDIYRDTGYWSGWFMGDGDKVGQTLKQIASHQGNQGLEQFSQQIRSWGQTFLQQPAPLAGGKARVIYAGGDDFLGVLCSEQAKHPQEQPQKVKPGQALAWLLTLPQQWQGLQTDLQDQFQIQQTFSVGFVWAGHGVPQRDILQHCRAAEKRAKSLGRDRVTLRVVFNSGQFVQWTCPWDCLEILTRYRDREGRTWGDPKLNWTHVYNDWAELKARHAIRLRAMGSNPVQVDLAIALLKFYFGDPDAMLLQPRNSERSGWAYVAGEDTARAIGQWIEELILVGWQLCSST
jgi:CRISPR-associated protein Cmr2